MKKRRLSFIVVIPAAMAMSCGVRTETNDKPIPVEQRPTPVGAVLEVPKSSPVITPTVTSLPTHTMNPPPEPKVVITSNPPEPEILPSKNPPPLPPKPR